MDELRQNSPVPNPANVFTERVVRLLDHQLSAEEESALAAELRGSEERRQEFVELCLQAQWLTDRLAVHSAQGDSGRFSSIQNIEEAAAHADGCEIPSDEGLPAIAAGLSGDTPVMGVVVPLSEDEEVEQIAPAPPVPAWPVAELPSRWKRWPGKAAMIALPLLLAIGAGVWMSKGHRSAAGPQAHAPKDVVDIAAHATLMEVIDARWGPPWASLRSGEMLPEEMLELQGGLVHLRMANGVSLIVEGPARFQLLSNAEARLDVGKLTALVPAQARGFMVVSPTATLTDLGTEFGLRVSAAGDAVASVFVGEVVLANGSGSSASAPLHITAGHAATANTTGVRPAPFDATSRDFVRDIHQARGPIPIYGTGFGVEPGQIDPHWRITEVQGDPKVVPGPVYAVKDLGRGIYFDDGSGAKWVSVGPDMPHVAGNGRYTYTTNFKLSRAVSETARLHLRISVDDGIAAVRLNGHDAGIQLDESKDWRKTASEFDIGPGGGFVNGENQLEVVVINRGNVKGQNSNPSGVRIEVSGTAVREVNANQE